MRTAFVIPWFGGDLVGGAEQHVYQVATRLARRGYHVEVFTTCCRSFGDDWEKNQLEEGVSEDSGLIVRRFPVAPRNAAAFDTANGELLARNRSPKRLGILPISQQAARAFVEENIRSPKLLEYVEQNNQDFRNIVFAPYLYGPTLLGVERAGRRAVLQPLLHDETYAYLPAVERIFHAARRIIFISEGEALLAARLYGPSMWRKGVIAGAGVEVAVASPSRTSEEQAPAVAPPYLLYLGRRDPAKGTPFLLNAFQRFRALHPGAALKLVLAGPNDLPAQQAGAAGIVDAGLVSDARREQLLRSCRALVQPSRNESYSRTLMEAWLHGKPVVVHADCLATSLAVEGSGGGWSGATEAEWAEIFAAIESSSERDLAARGERGQLHAREHADWDRAVDRYERALDLRPGPAAGRAARRTRLGTIHQLLPNLSSADAISNQAVFIRELLQELGYESQIFVHYLDDRMRELGRQFEPGLIRRRDALLYHHSIGTGLTAEAVRHRGPKALIYHNITPPHFFEQWDPAFARVLESGCDDLRALASAFPVSFGDSPYNASDLRRAGFAAPGILPIFVDPMRWAQPADPRWMQVLQDGRTNLLFVGRVVPNKCQHHLLHAFEEYLTFDPGARLVMAGGWRDGDQYADFVRDLVRSLGLASHVMLARDCNDAQLLACYRTAHVFWSMSEHEGFCVPLIEAMWFDVPVLAYRSSAVPETLGPAGVMFTEKRWPELAALAHLLVEDSNLRRTVIAGQRARRRDFLPEAILPSFLEVVRRLTGDPAEVRAVP